MAKIYVPDIECDSCVRLISRKLNDSRISGFIVGKDSVTLPENSRMAEAIKLIKGMGYRASEEPFERKTLNERVRHFKENTYKYDVEIKGLAYAINVFIILEILFIVAYFGFLSDIPGFLGTYGIWMLYLIISISALGFGLWHFLAYRAKITCMTGMMIGMTFGMQTGMLIGAILGATNGFFIGAFTGMLLGVLVGILTGRCCGVMGVMEGMMAGVMGGTMGPMITVMMLYDNIHFFMPFYLAVNLIIILGLSYMFYEEVVEKEEGVYKKPVDFATFAAASILVAFFISALIIYGPKSALASI